MDPDTKLYRGDGPFLSVYVTQPAVENTTQEGLLRWGSLRQRLPEAYPADVEAVSQALQTRSGAPVRCLVAAGGTLLLDQAMPHTPEMEEGYVLPLPHVMPLLAVTQCFRPYLVVKIDRTGAEIEVYENPLSLVSHEAVQGSHDELRKVKTGGGWHHKHSQMRAEDSWEGNGKEVAKKVDDLAHAIRAEAVLVSGDSRAVEKLAHHSSRYVQERMQVLSTGHGRRSDGGEEILQSEVDEILDSLARSYETNLLDRFRTEMAQGRGCEGERNVVLALQRGQADTLLIDRSSCATQGFFSEDPADIGLHAYDVSGHATQAPLCDVLIRTAILTGASVHVVDDPTLLREGVGAVLRYAL